MTSRNIQSDYERFRHEHGKSLQNVLQGEFEFVDPFSWWQRAIAWGVLLAVIVVAGVMVL